MKIEKSDFSWAVSRGLIEEAQADQLWEALRDHKKSHAKFDFVHVSYYFGALLVIGAMGWFMGSAWEAFGGGGIFLISLIYAGFFLYFGNRMWLRQDLKIPGGLLISMSVCMTPLAVYGLQRWLNVWAFDDPGEYRDFHNWIRGGWFAMEVATVAMGLLALRYYKFSFLTAPVACALWYISMDLTPIIADGEDYAWSLRSAVSMWFGLVMIIVAYIIDVRIKQDFCFWVYLFGTLTFWGGMTAGPWFADAEIYKFFGFLINIVLILLSVFLRRRVFMVFGAIGVFTYISYLAYQVFENSDLFPFVLTAFGLGLIYTGIKLQQSAKKLNIWFDNNIPTKLKTLRPPER